MAYEPITPEKGIGEPVFPKGLGNLSHLLKQAMNAKEKIEELRQNLGNEVVEASAGGGMVTVAMNGRFEVLSLKIDRDVVNPDDTEMLETLTMAALNEAVRKAQEVVKLKMTEITGGLDIPGLT
ncbi:MAG: YbaB/EbfC family nucleoid-associated protein [FCB group bacterium]|nr:YbaB/EbfC family nucleoid-associated protein [FCB group bacterium]